MSKKPIDPIEYKNAFDFAQAEKSDPFAYSRAVTHLKNGIARGFTQDGRPMGYAAEEDHETRQLPDGTKYQAVVYRNVVRP